MASSRLADQHPITCYNAGMERSDAVLAGRELLESEMRRAYHVLQDTLPLSHTFA